MYFLKDEAMAKVSKDLRLPFHKHMYDWDIEVSDINRIDEFLKYYKDNDLSLEERRVMVALVIASFDFYLIEVSENGNKLWDSIIEVMKDDILLFDGIREYWTMKHEVYEGGEFDVAKYLRRL